MHVRTCMSNRRSKKQRVKDRENPEHLVRRLGCFKTVFQYASYALFGCLQTSLVHLWLCGCEVVGVGERVGENGGGVL